jgi:hypothetical protein
MEVALVSIALIVGALVGWRLQRRHRGVPRGWSTAQSEAAALHRRLHHSVDDTRRAVARVGARGVPVDQLVSITEDLHVEALTIDRELVAASRLPDGARHKALVALKRRVVESERLARRVQDIATDMTAPTFEATDAGIRRLHERLDALEQARQEARDLGRDQEPGSESAQ